jgi:hypothetical protein
VTYATDPTLIHTILIKLNGRDLCESPLSQESIDYCLSETDCNYETMTKREFDRQFHCQEPPVFQSLPGKGFQTYRLPNIQHFILTSVTVTFRRQTGFQSGDILWKIRNIDTATLPHEVVKRLIEEAAVDEIVFLKREKYQRILERNNSFRSIQQEWDFECPCQHCSHIYLKGNLSSRIFKNLSYHRYSTE